MPAILAAFLTALMHAARLFVVMNVVGFAVRLFSAFGLYFFVMEPITDQISEMLQGRIAGAPAVVIVWLGYLQVDMYVQVILSAYTIVWASNFVLRMRQV